MKSHKIFSDVKIFFVRFRTAINVLGDSIGAGIVAHLSKDDLDDDDSDDDLGHQAKVNGGLVDESERL